VNALGLCTLDRTPRRVGLAYKRLIREWSEVLAAQSSCLQIQLGPDDGRH